MRVNTDAYPRYVPILMEFSRLLRQILSDGFFGGCFSEGSFGKEREGGIHYNGHIAGLPPVRHR